MIPLLSRKALKDFDPKEYQEYIRSLYIEPEKAKPLADFTVSINAKGNPVMRIRREPKWLSGDEVTTIAQECGWLYQRMWTHIKKKKIEIKLPKGKK